ncbi:type II toxin-antitoxin system Phd/YefM family antitoxin [Caballeronia sordidicola]|uniref:type II toxin-antitoxin system Phd/YefM family antitoxin n=1 Tax=Caballeronia sordidicola TaxID=196367 RepID=UPI0004CFEBDE|nr:type II toxin-antitoxin system Phd/YefM family antitoxin [Caballeronia sordidicola]
MQTVNIHDAKTNFSKLVDQAAAGEEIIIAKAGTPMARLVPLQKQKRKIQFGLMKDEIEIKPGFYDPMTDEEIALFEGAAGASAS